MNTECHDRKNDAKNKAPENDFDKCVRSRRIEFSSLIKPIDSCLGFQLQWKWAHVFRLQVPGDDQGSWYAEVTTATAGKRAIASFGEAEVVWSSDGEASVELRDEDFHGSVPRRTHAEIKQKVEVEYVSQSSYEDVEEHSGDAA